MLQSVSLGKNFPKFKERLQDHQGAVEPEGTTGCKALELCFKITHELASQPLGV